MVNELVSEEKITTVHSQTSSNFYLQIHTMSHNQCDGFVNIAIHILLPTKNVSQIGPLARQIIS